ncbi:MAG: hypothetical protein AB8F78_09530 [Saprospiraceae bacterium]
MFRFLPSTLLAFLSVLLIPTLTAQTFEVAEVTQASNGEVFTQRLSIDVFAAPDLTTGFTESIGGRFYLVGSTPSTGEELFRFNRSTGLAELVADINPGTGSSNPSDLTSFGDTLYFVATAPGLGREVWQTDGSASGTRNLANIQGGAGSAFDAPGEDSGILGIDATNLYVATNQSTFGDFYTIRRATGQAQRVAQSIGASYVEHIEGRSYLATSFGGAYLINSTNLSTIVPNGQGSTTDRYRFFEIAGTEAVVVTNGGVILFYDGSTNSSTTVQNNVSPQFNFFGTRGGSYPDGTYFLARDPNSAMTLWKTDGTVAGTFPLDVGQGTSNVRITDGVQWNDEWVFKNTPIGGTAGVYRVDRVRDTTELVYGARFTGPQANFDGRLLITESALVATWDSLQAAVVPVAGLQNVLTVEATAYGDYVDSRTNDDRAFILYYDCPDNVVQIDSFAICPDAQVSTPFGDRGTGLHTSAEELLYACDNISSVIVTAIPEPAFDVQAPDTVFIGDTIWYLASDPSFTYAWPDGSASEMYEVVADMVGQFEINVTATNDSGCTSIRTVTVVVVEVSSTFEEFELLGISLGPNPATSQSSIHGLPVEATWRITAINGATTSQWHQATETMFLAHFPKGLYFVEVKLVDGRQAVVGKLVVAK